MLPAGIYRVAGVLQMVSGLDAVVNVSMHSEGRYAFVELRTPEMASAALQLSGQVRLSAVFTTEPPIARWLRQGSPNSLRRVCMLLAVLGSDGSTSTAHVSRPLAASRACSGLARPAPCALLAQRGNANALCQRDCNLQLVCSRHALTVPVLLLSPGAAAGAAHLRGAAVRLCGPLRGAAGRRSSRGGPGAVQGVNPDRSTIVSTVHTCCLGASFSRWRPQ